MLISVVLGGRIFFLICAGLMMGMSVQAIAADANRESDRYTLAGLIARAIDAHPAVLSRRAEIDAARVDVESSRLQYYPAPSVQVAQDKGDTLTTVRLTQPLWAGGRIDAGLAAAQAREGAAGESLQETRQQLALRAVALWQSWQAASERATAIRRGLGLLDLYAQSVKRRIAGGFASETDQHLVVARISQEQGDLAAAETQGHSARTQLAQLVGIPLASDKLVLESPHGLEESRAAVGGASSLELVRQDALNTDPTLKRLEREIAAARADVRQKEAQKWPTVNLVGQHQQGDSAGVAVNDSSLMLTVEYAPGAGFFTAHAARAASARVVAQEQNLQARRIEIGDAVTVDFEDVAAYRQRQAQTAAAIAANRAVLASFDRQFAASRKTWLEVINAARELTQAETSAADIAAALIGAQWRLGIRTGQIPLPGVDLMSRGNS